MTRRLVGVFDSGVGGLTVLKECVAAMPDCDYLYLGDNANAPYGEKTKEEISRLVRSALAELAQCNVDCAVLACNTATAVCADGLRSEFSFPIVGTEPAVRPAAARCKNVLVLCTPCTAESARLSGLIAKYPACRFTVFPAGSLAGAIEACLLRGTAFDLGEHLPKGKFDGVVLGCTHYVFFKREIAAFYGAPVFDGGAGVAARVKVLSRGVYDHDITKSRKKIGNENHPMGELTTFAKNTNKRLFLFKNTLKTGEEGHIFFLGRSKDDNKRVYEQMFTFKNPSKMG